MQKNHWIQQQKEPQQSIGSDGFTTEFLIFNYLFYKFYINLGYFILRSINYDNSNTKKFGIITCITKLNKPMQFLKKLASVTSIAYTQ